MSAAAVSASLRTALTHVTDTLSRADASLVLPAADAVVNALHKIAPALVAPAAGGAPSKLAQLVKLASRAGAATDATSCASWLLCRFRLYPARCFYQLHFGLTMTSTWIGLFGAVLPMLALQRVGLVSERTVQKVTAYGAAAGCRWVFYCNPQLRIRTISAPPAVAATYATMDEQGGCTYALAGHSSQADGFIMVGPQALTPELMSRARFMGKAEVHSIPIFGYLVYDVLKYFKVYYKADLSKDGDAAAYNNWSLDREKMDAEMERVHTFISSESGVFVFSPEGRMTKTPEEIQPPRFGMLKILYKTKRPIFFIAMFGQEPFWPRLSPIGGFPSTVVMQLSKCEWPAESELPAEDTKEFAVALADHVHKFMQARLDECIAAQKAL